MEDEDGLDELDERVYAFIEATRSITTTDEDELADPEADETPAVDRGEYIGVGVILVFPEAGDDAKLFTSPLGDLE